MSTSTSYIDKKESLEGFLEALLNPHNLDSFLVVSWSLHLT
jgi:hypothetical protein